MHGVLCAAVTVISLGKQVVNTETFRKQTYNTVLRQSAMWDLPGAALFYLQKPSLQLVQE